MCSGSKAKPSPCEMEAVFQQDKEVISHKPSSNLLELAATDDLDGFIREVEENGRDVNEASFWYGRSFGSKKMGYEERTPIMIASLYGSTEVLRYIIQTKRVSVNQACGSDRATALHCAAAGGAWSCVEVVKILLEASADIHALDMTGRKPCDLIAPSVKSSTSSKRKTLEMMLNGVLVEDCHDKQDEVEEESRTPRAVKDGTEKKEYPIDVPLPDINVGVYMTDEFRMYTFKIKTCSRAYSHDWTECPFVHPGENARRRDPRKFNYTCVPCPEFKKGNCPKGDSCEYAHGVFESWLHPAQYRTRLCKDETGCSRKVCFFAHKPEELRPLYASTGSGMPSPKSMSIGSLDMSNLSPLNLGSPSLMMSNSSTPPMSPSIACSSPMSGNLWQSKVNNTPPPTLQLPRSRLKTGLSARDMDLDMGVLNLEKIRTQMVEEMASISSPYSRMPELKPTNLDDVFGSIDPSLLSQLQNLSPKVNTQSSQIQSPSGMQIRQNMNQLRASYPSNISSSPARKSPAYGFDSSAAVAQAVMNSRSAAFAKRSQSFVDRSGGGVNYRSTLSGSVNSPMPSKFSEWGSPDGRVDWGFNGHDDANKLRKSASFGLRSGDVTKLPSMEGLKVNEPDVSWVDSLVKNGPFGGGGGDWIDQMYAEKEHVFA